MSNMFHDIPLGNENFSEINAILEIPKGSSMKYEFDHNTGAIWVDRGLKTPITYSFNYGDLPQTWNHWDNDPLDVIILCSQALPVWVVVPTRVIGWLKMIDWGEDDYKVLAVADDKYYSHVQSSDDVSPKELEDIEYFMLHYKDLEWKKVELNWWDTKENAMKRLAECHKDYKEKFGK